MRVLVTGASGYLASRLVPLMVADGYDVIGLDRRLPASVSPMHDFVHADLNEPQAYAFACVAADAVVHLAAARTDWGLSALDYQRENTDATVQLLRTATRVKRWVFTSSVAVYGASDSLLDETALCRPETEYGWSKLRAEEALRSAVAERRGTLAILRPSAFFGPNHPSDTNVHRLVSALSRGRFALVGRGANVKTTSYVDNIAAAVSFSLSRTDRNLEIFNYVDNPALTTRELVARICEELGRPLPRARVPVSLAFAGAFAGDVLGRVVKRDIPVTTSRVAKFRASTLYSAKRIRSAGYVQPISVEEAIRRTVSWHQAQP